MAETIYIVDSLPDERRRIADALARCPDEAWSAIGDLFLQAHYPPRLSSLVLCPKCGARNDVDAPYDQVLARWVEQLRRAR